MVDRKTNNQLKPNLQLNNEGTSAVPLEQVTVRYWFTAENYAPHQYVGRLCPGWYG